MKKSFCFALALTLLAPMAMASTANQISLIGEQELIFTKKNKKKYELIQKNLKAKALFQELRDGKIDLVKSEDLIEETDLVSGSLLINKRGDVILIDSMEKIFGTVKADINSSLLGNIKGIEITKANHKYLKDKTYAQIMSDLIAESRFLYGMIDHSVSVSTIKCKSVSEKTLTCLMSFAYKAKENVEGNAAYEIKKKKILGL